MRWEDLTWMEIDRLDRSIPIVMNVASIEQHGPHLPVSTDSAIGGFFMDELDRRAGADVLVLPQVKVCCSAHHMDFPGTLTVSHETLLAYLSEMLESAVAHGFRNIVLVNSHGGNRAIGQVLLEKFGAAHPECQVVFLTWWHMAAEELAGIRESGFAGVGHACEFETAIMMHGVPGSVRSELIAGQNYVPTYPWADSDMMLSGKAALFRTIKASSNGTGVLGDPSLASEEKGRRITEAVMENLVDIVRNLRAPPRIARSAAE